MKKNIVEFVKLSNADALADFLDRVDQFHDALVREVGILSRGYVAHDGNMYGDSAPYDLRLIFHSQNADTPLIEVIFEDVATFNMATGFPLEPNGTIAENRVVFHLSENAYKERFMVVAKAMKYRILGTESLGEEPITVQRIMSPQDET